MNISKNFRSTTYGRIVPDVSARKYGLRETISEEHNPYTFYEVSQKYVPLTQVNHVQNLQLAPALSTATKS